MTLAPLREAADSLAKASTPEPFSASRTSNWVARVGGLPAYIQHIAHDLMEKRGMTESRAIATAVAIVKNPPRNWGAQARAAAAKAAAQWEAKKGASHAKVQHADLPLAVPTLADELAVRESAILRLAIFEQQVGQEGILELLDPASLMEAASGFAPKLRRVASAPGESERHEVVDGDQTVGTVTKQTPGYNGEVRYRALAVNGDRVGDMGLKSRQAALDALRTHLEEAPARVMAHRDGKFLVARPKSYGGTMSYDEFPNEQSARHAAGLPPSASSPERASQVEQLGEMISFDLATAAGVPPVDRLRRAAEARLGGPLAEAFNPGELRNFIGRWTKGGSHHTMSLGALKDLGKLPPASTRMPGRVTAAARSAESRARIRASAAARKAHAAKPQISVDDLEKGLPEGVWSAGAKSALDRLRDGSIKNTVQAHTDRQGNFSEERQQLHERILSDLLQGKATHVGKAIAVFTAGGPASGKSSVIDNGLVPVPHDSVQVSPDIIRKMLPEYQMLKDAGRQDLVGPATHDEAAMLTHQLMRLAMARQHHMVVDTVGDSEMGQFADKVHATDQAGYKVHVHYVTIPTAEAIRRSDARAAGAGKASDKGRVVDHAGLTELHRDVSRRFVDVARMKRVHVTVFSNDVPRGQNPVMIAEKHPGSDKIHIKDRKKFLGFLRKGVETTSNAAERSSNAAERRR